MSTISTRTLLGNRPQNVPADWPIYSAPRPLYGDMEWRDGGGAGFFYVAVNPTGERAAWMNEQNARNGAELFIYVGEEEAYSAGRQQLIDLYSERGQLDADRQAVLDDPDSRTWIVERYIRLLNR